MTNRPNCKMFRRRDQPATCRVVGRDSSREARLATLAKSRSKQVGMAGKLASQKTSSPETYNARGHSHADKFNTLKKNGLERSGERAAQSNGF